MRRWLIKVFAALLTVLLVLPQAVVSAGDPQCECEPICSCESACECEQSSEGEPLPESGNERLDGLISSYDELTAAVALGGALIFGADITVPPGGYLDLGYVQVETGEFSLIVEGMLFLGQDTVVSGDGKSGAEIGRAHV